MIEIIHCKSIVSTMGLQLGDSMCASLRKSDLFLEQSEYVMGGKVYSLKSVVTVLDRIAQ